MRAPAKTVGLARALRRRMTLPEVVLCCGERFEKGNWRVCAFGVSARSDLTFSTSIAPQRVWRSRLTASRTTPMREHAVTNAGERGLRSTR